ncbi:MAG: sulfotransferase [Steroidobacteraceae bacterium]
MNADDLIARAVQRCGYPDSRGTYRIGLDKFLEDFARSPTVTELGKQAAEGWVLDALAARFSIDGWIADHPEVLEHAVQRPVFITGLPRAGTTLLLNLLALDPQHRVYGIWESNREVPPVEAAHLHDDPRIARKVEEVNAALASGFLDHRYHVEMGDEPGECVWLLGQDFKSYPWLILTPAPKYFEWLMHEARLLDAYRHHRRALQVMQSRAPGQWILKFPLHAAFLDELLSVYPDARIVLTHRDPVAPLASSCSASFHLTKQFNAGLSPVYTGQETLSIVSASLRGACSLRQRHPETPVLDFHYSRFVQDPIAEIRSLYRFMGEELVPEIELHMRQALDKQRALRKQVGKHEYSLEEFGLREAQLPSIFDEYVEQFGIAREAPRGGS